MTQNQQNEPFGTVPGAAHHEGQNAGCIISITQIPQAFHWFDLPHEIKITVRKEIVRKIYTSLRDWETPPLGGEGQVRNLLPLLSAWSGWADS